MTSDLTSASAGRGDLPELAKAYDTFNMASVIQRLPSQIETALADPIPNVAERTYKQVVMAGMGGSALPMDVVTDAFGNVLSVPIQVWRNYNLPTDVDDSTLVIVSSFSGETEETVSALEQMPNKAPNAIVVCHGGRLESLGKEKSIPVIRLRVEQEPEGFQPRSAVGYFVTYFARILADAGLMPQPNEQLDSVCSFLRSIDIRTPAEDVALWLRDRIPVIYTDDVHMSSIARIAKIKFNENSKRPAFFNTIPEASHNEMIGFSKNLGQFGILYIHDNDSNPSIRKRFTTMKNVFQSKQLDHVSFREWTMPGESRIQRLFASLVFADWCSYSLALLDGVDPTPVELVEHFKRELVNPVDPS
jgi:glucose/mannose-6-phosphate isomerase